MNAPLPEMQVRQLHDRFAAVRARIEKAAAASGRDAAAVTLVAISKTHPAPVLAALLAAWRANPVFGENYMQEALAKQDEIASFVAGPKGRGLPSPEWHFTGHVQSRKAKEIAGRFALIHTLDSEKLALAVQKAVIVGSLEPQAVLVQINIGREEQKSGVPAEDAERLLEAIMPIGEVSVQGLMCIPPFDADDTRPYFAAMRELRDRLARSTGLALPHLSMGMSHDFEAAIAEGATMVRVGTDIFGPRPARKM